MELTALTAISAIDGRYRQQVQQLDEYFSEFGLMKYRVTIEIEYLLFLAEEGFLSLSPRTSKHLRTLATSFGPEHAAQIKKIEQTTNHDVKAVEYFLKKELETSGGKKILEWVHFGLTSQDINNTAIPLSWKHAIEYEYLPSLLNLNMQFRLLAKEWKNIPMLAHTHGQPASPTRLGKEIMVFNERIQNQIEQFIHIPFSGKFGGATGNFNAHNVAFPKTNWVTFGNDFLDKLGLSRQQFTTQIEHYDNFAAHFDCMKRINNILIDFCRDVWTYISMEYFKQRTKAGEVGSSAMPHKVNPIDFENAEGNLGLANAIFEHLAAKLPISRLQRDLTDSTVLRNIGVPFAHTIIAMRSIEKGLGKLVINPSKIEADLEKNWAVVSEAIQTILRRENYPQPYEALKDLTRGNQSITKQSISTFIDGLKIDNELKKTLKKITPQNYTGVMAKF
ncbi:MAG: adenylosuccinate lyase [Chitinophagaceae bacterium]|nr:MAG: adenylosuccinate lyase [Chitinophagaceae bacterium]